MAENAPPGTNGANGTSDAARGQPYYEKLRRDLRDAIQKKRILDQNMANLEDTIYKIESSYLEEASAGNIIKGFDSYIKGSTGGIAGGTGGGTATRRKATISDADRIFSRSSASFNNVRWMRLRLMVDRG
ncbi:NuA4-domain-containing protein [Patellaria atrata CBS 101060]|uniref:Chromatin modification-related protein EAF6 n=1 Tax=Patellaria atrata CBS 101060 TaxID=1346257 RepID=A0A9P4VJQ6_9PEZI|nr:NuA4-domain-containing protein [Patellaria atrata CBS 101060]